MTEILDDYDAKIYNSRGEYIGVAEIKHRNNSFIKYPDYQIDIDKIHRLIHAARRDDVRAVLVVSWEGDIRYASISKAAEGWEGQCDLFPTTLTKRRDRKEYADHQYHIPPTIFRKI